MSCVSSIRAARSRSAIPAVGSSMSRSFGLARQRDGELDPLHVPVGKLRAGPICRRPPFRPAPARLDAGSRCCSRAGVPEREAPVMMADQRHLDVLAHAHRMKRLGDLECPPDAEAEALLRRGVRDGPAVEADDPAIRADLAADHAEDRRLAGAVGADERHHLAALDGEAHIPRRDNATERFRQIVAPPEGSCAILAPLPDRAHEPARETPAP